MKEVEACLKLSTPFLYLGYGKSWNAGMNQASEN